MRHQQDLLSRFPQWLKWFVGVTTFLSISILLLAIVLGIRAGQRQFDIRNRQQAGIYLQQAVDHRTDGDLPNALNAYQQVLLYDPDNEAAQSAVDELVLLVSAGGSGVTQVTENPASESEPESEQLAESSSLAAETEASPQGNAPNSLDGEWSNAVEEYNSGQWQDALTVLQQIQATDGDYRPQDVASLIYKTQIQLAGEQERADNFSGALYYYDQALVVLPNGPEALAGRTILQQYVEVLQLGDADWAQMVDALEELYVLDSGYRDVRERLQRAHMQYGDSLVQENQWCDAVEQYDAAIDIQVTPGSISKRDRYRQFCNDPSSAVVAITEPTDIPALTDDLETDVSSAQATDTQESSVEERAVDEDEATVTTPTVAEPTAAPAVSGSPTVGKILYSSRSPGDGRSLVYLQPVSGGAPSVLATDATQPAMRNDGQRVSFRNLRDDQVGISSLDPATGLELRFTQFAEDSMPSWSADGNRIVFASNREGDRLWRIYTVWAEANGATQNFSFGEAPSWHPSQDRVVFRGCDERGNACGLWTMNGNGGDRTPLTSVAADTRPSWSPDGGVVVFMSGGRDGNTEIYRVNASGGAADRLTNSPNNDVAPSVDPTGQWVAFLSDRSGSWEIWAVPITGGEAQLIAPVAGQLGSWLEHNIQWIQ